MSEQETRAELVTTLGTLAGAAPQMRVGQLVAAVGEVCADLHGRGLWDASDSELLQAISEFRRGFEKAGISPTGTGA